MTQVRTTPGIEADLHEVVESVIDVVLRLGPTAIAAKLGNKCFWPDIQDSHRFPFRIEIQVNRPSSDELDPAIFI